jgi:hypothetical protein
MPFSVGGEQDYKTKKIKALLKEPKDRKKPETGNET